MNPWAAPRHEFLPRPPIAAPLPLITPLQVFAAGRERFDVIVRRNMQKPAVLDALFEALPLAEHGWDRGSLKLRHIGNSERLYPIWRLERG